VSRCPKLSGGRRDGKRPRAVSPGEGPDVEAGQSAATDGVYLYSSDSAMSSRFIAMPASAPSAAATITS
jgi:hypothetical protein